jgi:hypothetical protein
VVRRPACSRRTPRIDQTACKPGSVWPASELTDVTAIPLVRRLPGASSNLPERPIRTGSGASPARSYSVLLPVGFTVPPSLPKARCALAAPFHPCRGQNATRRGGLFSVALSLNGNCRPPDVIRHRLSMEPGLSSPPAFRHWRGAAVRPTDVKRNGGGEPPPSRPLTVPDAFTARSRRCPSSSIWSADRPAWTWCGSRTRLCDGFGDRCRVIVRTHINRFGERVSVRRRICD